MFKGSIVALVTPFNQNKEIDLDSFNALIEWHIKSGTKGILIGGTTGEAPVLSADEYETLLKTAVDKIAGRVPVMAGCGSNNTEAAVKMTNIAHTCGANAGLSVTPAYNKPTQRGLYEHFKTIERETELPIFMYNVPGRTGISFRAETVAELAKLPGIAGIKEASADMALAADIKRLTPDDFIMVSGDDLSALPFYALGGRGVISVTANVLPTQVADVYNLFERGERDAALRLHLKLMPLHKAMFIETNPAPAKAALALMSRIKNILRLPLVELSEEKTPELEAVLKNYDT